MGSLYSKKMEFEKALELYNAAISIDPTYTKAMFNKALTLANMGRWEETKKIMEILISHEKPSWEYYNLLGFALLKQNDPVEALNYFRKALQLSPTNSYALFTHRGLPEHNGSSLPSQLVFTSVSSDISR